MVHRDPETGKFVSDDVGGDLPDWHETSAIGGVVSAEIPAADLSGGTTIHESLGSGEIELVDFADVVGNDEVFQVQQMLVNANFAIHTTSSGQSYAVCGYEIGGNTNTPLQGQAPAFWATEEEEGVYDIATTSAEVENVLHAGRMHAVAQSQDATNGLASGPHADTVSEVVNFQEAGFEGPVFDSDDELYAPQRFYTDAVSNMAVESNISVLFRGVVHDLD